MEWKQGGNVNWFIEIMAVMKQIELGEVNGASGISGMKGGN